MDEPDFVPLQFAPYPKEEMKERAIEFFNMLKKRRSMRDFSPQPVAKELIEYAIRSAGTAPSGAHLQPWTFVAISNLELKEKIRAAAEKEEKKSYEQRMPEEWLEVLAPLGTDFVKEHLTDAPWVVVLFRQTMRMRENGEWGPTYYSIESVGIAAGMFISAIHQMGLCTLTHTPSPMKFLGEILKRPDHETAMLVLPVGYPKDEAKVPNIERKDLGEISVFLE
ncbi:MAG: nitroreductase family protein [Methanobacteriota archaeon]|jgi:nitroreductase|nr:MAG: nitroreductase family protein [Euryarchaeota archaeon]HIK78321.1 nitroreductase family protein [Candidatus Poseidoniales archaeon]